MNLFQKIFWSRLQDVQIVTWGYLVYHLFAMVMMRVFLNSNVFFSNIDFWLGIIFLEHVFVFTSYILAQRFIKRTSPALVIIVSVLVGAIRTWFTSALAMDAGLQAEVNWIFQILSGAFFELIMVCIWANVNGAYRDHQVLLSKLDETKNTILGYRENAEMILAEEQEKLLENTRSSLLPQIHLIEKAIGELDREASNRWGVANDLKGLINNQVRPLSESLRQSAKLLVAPAANTPNRIKRIFSIPRRFHLTNSIFPTINSLTMVLGFSVAPLWILDENWVLISVALCGAYFAVLVGLKQLAASWPRVNRWLGIPVLIIFAILPALPAYAAAVLFYPNVKQAVLYGLSMMFLSAVVFLSLALLDSFDYSSREYRELLDQEIRALSLEMALFEQQLWAARRHWSLIVHGTVQASLSAALTRLNSPDANKQTLNLVKKDLDRAVVALTTTPNVELKFNSALKELVSTWQGVCDIELTISAELKRILSQDSRLSMCVNEILKEAISNAVRHGDARRADIKFTQTDSGVFQLSVSNDGFAPKPSKRKGLGSSLLDELTLDWKLFFDPNVHQTVLIAHLPFSKSQL